MTGLHLYLGNKNYSSWSLRAWLVLKQTGAPFWGNGDPALPGRIARKASPRLTEPARTRTQARRSCTLGIIGDRRVSGRTVSRGRPVAARTPGACLGACGQQRNARRFLGIALALADGHARPASQAPAKSRSNGGYRAYRQHLVGLSRPFRHRGRFSLRSLHDR